jgi:hypothetical protein
MSVDMTSSVHDGLGRTGDDRFTGTPLGVPHWLEGPTGFPGAPVVHTGPEVLASVRGMRLTRNQVEEVLAFAEFMAGRVLSATDRAELTEDIVDAFEDSPKSALRFLRPLAGGVARIASLEPTERCQRRLRALTSSYALDQKKRSDGAEPDPIMRVIARYNPLIRYWAATGIVLVADALTARHECHRVVLSLVDAPVESADSLTSRLVGRLDQAGAIEIAELAAAELRLLETRAWLRDLGSNALNSLREDVSRAVVSALDVDIVVQQVSYRAALGLQR